MQPSQRPDEEGIQVHLKDLIRLNPELAKSATLSAPTPPKGLPTMVFRCPYCQKPVALQANQCDACGRLVDRVHKAGELIRDRYRIEDLMVQHGAFGRVYDVLDVQSNRPLSMKQLIQGAGIRPKDIELFKREGLILGRIKHRGVPAFVDAFEHQGSHYLVMERVEGVPLSHHQRDVGPMTEAEILAILPQILDIFEHLHGLTPPVIHRDVKPGNFMKTLAGNRIYLVDFGSATYWGTRRNDEPVIEGPARERTRIWTKGLAAPEILLGQEFYPATDLFGLGLTLIYLLTNAHPIGLYEARTGTYLFSDTVCSPALKAIISKMVQLPVEDRYQSAGEVREALRAANLI